MHSQTQPQRDGSVNPHAIYHVRAIYNPTNNAMPIKFRTQNPNTISTTIFAKQPSQNPPHKFSFWRRYTFLRVRLRNKRFLPRLQKTDRRYGLRLQLMQDVLRISAIFYIKISMEGFTLPQILQSLLILFSFLFLFQLSFLFQLLLLLLLLQLLFPLQLFLLGKL